MLPSILFRLKMFGATANAARPNNSMSSEIVGTYVVIFGSLICLLVKAFKTIITDINQRIKGGS